MLVDSCVLLDVFNDDPKWSEWSSEILYEHSKRNQLAINIIVFTEVAFNFDSRGQLEDTLAHLEIDLLTIPCAAAFEVSQVFRKYRQNKGIKKSPMPDFYIGAHAKHLNAPLITRDESRFSTYFPGLELITPTHRT